MQDDLSEAEIKDWLDKKLDGAPNIHDVSDKTGCTDQDRVLDVPAALDPFEESFDKVDWYTKTMLKQDIHHPFYTAMKDTNLAEYWGAASYLRRLLSQQMAGSNMQAAASKPMPVSSTTKIGPNLAAVDMTDPYFWRELGAIFGLDTNTTQDEIMQLWKVMGLSAGQPNVNTFLAAAARQSGLTVSQLTDTPLAANYLGKGHAKLGLSAQFLDPSTWVKDYSPGLGDYVVFSGNGSACDSKIYQVTAAPAQTASKVHLVAVALAPTDPKYTATNTHAATKQQVTALGLDGSALAFFFESYATASAFSCDPGAALPGSQVSAGRRRLGLWYRGWSGCSRWRPCAECQGDCDRDSECKSGLKCFQRSGYTKVPTCGSSSGRRHADYCYRPPSAAVLPASGGISGRFPKIDVSQGIAIPAAWGSNPKGKVGQVEYEM
eukprot:COSAG01_NODE_1846_length_9050_cov_10.563991_6_plen_434_part_00